MDDNLGLFAASKVRSTEHDTIKHMISVPCH